MIIFLFTFVIKQNKKPLKQIDYRLDDCLNICFFFTKNHDMKVVVDTRVFLGVRKKNDETWYLPCIVT